MLSASGTFYVDWNDGSTVQVITRNNTTPTEYSHTYTTSGQRVIKFAGLATGYNTTSYNQDKDSSGATTCSACGSNSSTVAQNGAVACTCDTGYTADGAINGSTTSINGCLEIGGDVLSCNNGYYLPANSNTCAKCPANNYCPSGTYTFDSENNQGINACQSGLFAPVGMWESAQCGHILHVGEKYVYLRSTKQTIPSLNVDVDYDGIPDFFGNMSTTPVPMNADFSNLQDNNKLIVNMPAGLTGIQSGVYYIYDDTVSAN